MTRLLQIVRISFSVLPYELKTHHIHTYIFTAFKVENVFKWTKITSKFKNCNTPSLIFRMSFNILQKKSHHIHFENIPLFLISQYRWLNSKFNQNAIIFSFSCRSNLTVLSVRRGNCMHGCGYKYLYVLIFFFVVIL